VYVHKTFTSDKKNLGWKSLEFMNISLKTFRLNALEFIRITSFNCLYDSFIYPFMRRLSVCSEPYREALYLPHLIAAEDVPRDCRYLYPSSSTDVVVLGRLTNCVRYLASNETRRWLWIANFRGWAKNLGHHPTIHRGDVNRMKYVQIRFGRCLRNRLLSDSSVRFTTRPFGCALRRALYWEL
jgi:hypothetical protein